MLLVCLIILRWGMAILKTPHWWENSVEMAVMSQHSCRPHKVVWGSGDAEEDVNKNCTFPIIFIKNLTFRFTSNYFENGIGFKIGYESSYVSKWTYSSGQCGGNYTTRNGILTSTSYPDNYPNNEDCVFTISQPTGTAIVLKFMTMDIESHSTCKFDYLEIRDGISDDSPVLIKLCGNEIPAPIQLIQNQVWMKWGHKF